MRGYDDWATSGGRNVCPHCGRAWYDSDGGCEACAEALEEWQDAVLGVRGAREALVASGCARARWGRLEWAWGREAWEQGMEEDDARRVVVEFLDLYHRDPEAAGEIFA